jgi:Ser/Thr protein kinase RdoA (MazF antagonist)
MIHNGASLHEHNGFRFTLFPRRGGRAPEPGNLDQLYRLGQLLGRLHAVGATKPFEHREALGVKNFGQDSLTTLLEGNFVPKSLLPAYESVARDLLKRVEEVYKATPHQNIRMHGDCHPGNMMCRDEMFHIVDLDDCRMGPAVQDIWMMLAGDRQECLGQLSELMDGYNEFHDFDPRELALIEPLRALGLLHTNAPRPPRGGPPPGPPPIARVGAAGSGFERAAARLASDALQRLARPALGRPGVPPQFSVVRHGAVLGRSGVGIARTTCGAQ